MSFCGRSTKVGPDNMQTVKYFEFPPKKCFLRTDGISAAYSAMEDYVQSFLGSSRSVPFTISYGTKNQYDFAGKYCGNQCTSMALAAIGWWCLMGDCGTFRNVDIERAMETGNALHTVLRNDYKLSTNSDKRIAIDDLPRRLEVGLFDSWSRFQSLEDADSIVLTSPMEDLFGLSLLKEYLQSRLDANRNAPEAYLLTIGSSSNAIMFTKSGTWLWFDSHGSQQVSANQLKRPGSVTELATLGDLAMFVIALRGPRQYCQIRSLTCERVQEEAVKQASPVPVSLDNKKAAANEPARPPTPVAAPPVTCRSEIPAPTKAATPFTYDEEDFEEDSCYVSFMGGFGCD